MSDERFRGIDLAKSLHPLLGGWRDIREESTSLLSKLDALPRNCKCPGGGEICACCATHHRPFAEQCRSCANVVHSLSDRIDWLLDDTLRYLPAVAELAHRREGALEQQIMRVGSRVVELRQTITSLAVSSGEFQHGCAIEHVDAVRDTVSGIARDVRELETRLEHSTRLLPTSRGDFL